ncbi:Olfactory receptor 51L1 [Camelus dromedarius]|uniref:Olfactory receptor 51L1 n=1 Tax=Camelus dromedarius TaxID=9838 RepID=A0A5N4DM06_CAMDR|nr:Olfactory receptor 51L1 [Camelus dromedarius]
MPEKDFWLALLLCLHYGFTFLGVLVAMAFDCFVDIHFLLHCATIFTHGVISKIGAAVLLWSAVLGIASWQERLKALNTCLSHICALLLFYVPLIGMILSHCLEKHLSPVVHTVMASIYLLVPPVLNPVVYSVRTKEIQQRIAQVFSGGRTGF